MTPQKRKLSEHFMEPASDLAWRVQANVVGQDVEKYRELTKGELDLIAELNSIATKFNHGRSAAWTPVFAFNATPPFNE